MKKIFLIAALGVAGLASANNVDLKKDDHKEKTEKKNADANQDNPESKMQCV